MTLNLKSTFICSKLISKVMISQASGCIINIASSAGERPMVDNAAYGAAKAAVINLTQTMAVSLAPYNVRVHAISPGPVIAASFPGAPALGVPKPGGGKLPLDITMAALFLASEASSNMTGINLLMRKSKDG